MARRVRDEAVGRRARLRRRELEDYETPPTEGPHDATEASLVWIGGPAGAASKTARFGPKGFALAKKGAESVGKHVMRVLKPILSKGVKSGAKK